MVDLTVSNELRDTITLSEFERHLRMFNATVIGTRPADFGNETIYALDIPDAPEGAASVTPVFQSHCEGDTVTVSVLSLDWRDAAGNPIATHEPTP